MTAGYKGGTRREIAELAKAQPGYGQASFEYLDPELADMTHAVGVRAGLVGPNVPFPSVRLTGEQRHAADGRVVLSTLGVDDPRLALEGVTSHRAAVYEQYTRQDEDNGGGLTSTSKAAWLGFNSRGEAQDYVNTNGDYVEIPGPGEGLGQSWTRTAYDNPYYTGPTE